MNVQASKSWLNALGFVAMIVMNIVAESLPLGGKTTGEISAQYPVLITPASYAFLIWSVIYILLLLYVFFGFTKTAIQSEVNQAIGIWFFVSCLLNIGWLWAWHAEQLVISGILMIALLCCLLLIHFQIQKSSSVFITAAEKWLIRLPFRIYLGWISVASAVNLFVIWKANGWYAFGLSETVWAVLALGILMTISLLTLIYDKNFAYTAVIIWSCLAIAIKQWEHSIVAYTSLTVVIILVASIVWQVMNRQTAQTS